MHSDVEYPITAIDQEPCESTTIFSENISTHLSSILPEEFMISHSSEVVDVGIVLIDADIENPIYEVRNIDDEMPHL